MSLNNKYPLKYGVLYVLAKEDCEISIEDVIKQLEPIFGNEKQFNKKLIRFHLDSFTCVDMVEIKNESFNSDGELTANYKITPFGKSRSSFLPDEWKEDVK